MAKDIYDYATEYLTKLMSAGDKDGDNIVPAVKKVVFNNPATIVFWSDGTKTVVKCEKTDDYDPYYGFCAAVTKKALGSSSAVKKIVEKYNNEKTKSKVKQDDCRTNGSENKIRHCAVCNYAFCPSSEEPCNKCFKLDDKPYFTPIA